MVQDPGFRVQGLRGLVGVGGRRFWVYRFTGSCGRFSARGSGFRGLGCCGLHGLLFGILGVKAPKP